MVDGSSVRIQDVSAECTNDANALIMARWTPRQEARTRINSLKPPYNPWRVSSQDAVWKILGDENKNVHLIKLDAKSNGAKKSRCNIRTSQEVCHGVCGSEKC